MKYLNLQYIRKLYYDLNLSVDEIAYKCNCSRGTIYSFFKKNGIIPKRIAELSRIKEAKAHNNHYCECGCGRITSIIKCNNKNKGETRGEPHRFIHGHNKPWLGLKRSKEDREKFSSSHIGLKYPNRKSPENGAWNKGTNNSGMKGKHHSEESKQKSSESNRGLKRSDECKRKLRKIHKERWKNPEYVKKMAKAFRITPNKSEMLILDLLNDLYPGEWKYTGDFSFTINGKCPDFVNCNGQKKCIEFNGTYWHQDDIPGEREKIFAEFGYDTLIIWDTEMKDMDSVIEKIKTFHDVGKINARC